MLAALTAAWAQDHAVVVFRVQGFGGSFKGIYRLLQGFLQGIYRVLGSGFRVWGSGCFGFRV